MWYEKVLEFITLYWRELLTLLACVLTVLFNLIRRRPSYNLVDEIKKDLLELLPELIVSVEVPGEGSKKKDAVLKFVNKFLGAKYHISCTSDLFPELYKYASDAIEKILSTPSKKEVK